MTSFEINLAKIIKSRGITWLIILLALSASFYSFLIGDRFSNDVDFGILFPSPEFWMSSLFWLYSVNIVGCFLCGFLMVALNRTFNLLRTVSDLFVAIFFVMQFALSGSMNSFSGGIILACIVLICMIMLYSLYLRPDLTRRVFLIFFILSCGALFEYGFLFFILLFMAGCSQMRIITFRSVLAVLMGLVTPYCIVLGLGIVNFDAFHLLPVPDYEGFFQPGDNPCEVLILAFTLLLGLVAGLMNIFRVISFNNQGRTFFIFLSSVGILSGILCVVDFNNMLFYAPTLYAVTSMQVCMCMRLYEKSRSYIYLPVVLIAYALFYFWSVTI